MRTLTAQDVGPEFVVRTDTGPGPEQDGVTPRPAGLRVPRLVLVALSLASLPFAWTVMFGSFAYYDDEGYFVLTLAEWARQGGLYDRVYSQYGPFWVELLGLPLRLTGVEMDLFHGRVVTLGVWIIATLLVGLLVLQLTRRTLMAVIAQATTLLGLVGLANEPPYAGGLAFLLLVAAMLAIAAYRPRQPDRSYWLVGALLGATLLTKVNVGVFACVGVLLAYSATTNWSGRRWLRPLSALVAALLGAVLFASVSGAWVADLRVVYLGAIASLVIALRSKAAAADADGLPPSALVRAASGMGVVAAVVVGIALATGTSAGGLVRGVLIRPLGQAGALTVPADASGGVWFAVAVPVALLALQTRRWWPDLAVWGALLLSGPVRIGMALVFLRSVVGVAWPSPYLLVPLVPLCLVPRRRAEVDGDQFVARRLIAALAVLEMLQAFPVAGTQLGLSVCLMIPAFVLILSDGIAEIEAFRAPAVHLADRPRPTLGTGLAIASLALLVVPGWPFARNYVQRYAAAEPLELPGAGSIRVARPFGAALEQVAAAVRAAGCTQLLSTPGLNSFYLFTGLRPPTGYNTTAWGALLDVREQQATLDVLRAAPAPACLIRWVPTFYTSQVDPAIAGRPLVHYTDDGHWRQVLAYDTYVLYTRAEG